MAKDRLQKAFNSDPSRQELCAFLDAAAAGNNAAVTEFLKKHKACIDRKAKYGRTALMLAVQGSRRDTVELLLANGADINTKDRDGYTAMIYALGNKDMAALLLRHGAAPNEKDKEGTAPILYAAGEGQTGIVELLLRHGAPVDERNNYGWTPLICAAAGGYKDTVELLLKKGADIDAKDDWGGTALTAAERNKKTEVIELLKRQSVRQLKKDMKPPRP